MKTFTFENETETVKFCNVQNPACRKEELERCGIAFDSDDEIYNYEYSEDYKIVDEDGDSVCSDYIAIDLSKYEA